MNNLFLDKIGNPRQDMQSVKFQLSNLVCDTSRPALEAVQKCYEKYRYGRKGQECADLYFKFKIDCEIEVNSKVWLIAQQNVLFYTQILKEYFIEVRNIIEQKAMILTLQAMKEISCSKYLILVPRIIEKDDIRVVLGHGMDILNREIKKTKKEDSIIVFKREDKVVFVTPKLVTCVDLVVSDVVIDEPLEISIMVDAIHEVVVCMLDDSKMASVEVNGIERRRGLLSPGVVEEKELKMDTGLSMCDPGGNILDVEIPFKKVLSVGYLVDEVREKEYEDQGIHSFINQSGIVYRCQVCMLVLTEFTASKTQLAKRVEGRCLSCVEKQLERRSRTIKFDSRMPYYSVYESKDTLRLNEIVELRDGTTDYVLLEVKVDSVVKYGESDQSDDFPKLTVKRLIIDTLRERKAWDIVVAKKRIKYIPNSVLVHADGKIIKVFKREIMSVLETDQALCEYLYKENAHVVALIGRDFPDLLALYFLAYEFQINAVKYRVYYSLRADGGRFLRVGKRWERYVRTNGEYYNNWSGAIFPFRYTSWVDVLRLRDWKIYFKSYLENKERLK